MNPIIATAPVVVETAGVPHSQCQAESWFETVLLRAVKIWKEEDEKQHRFPGMFFFLLPGEDGEIMGVSEKVFPPKMKFNIVRELSREMGVVYVIYVSEAVVADGTDDDLLAVNGDVSKMQTARRSLFISIDGVGLNRSRVYPFEGTEIDESSFMEMPVPEHSEAYNLSGQLGLN